MPRGGQRPHAPVGGECRRQTAGGGEPVTQAPSTTVTLDLVSMLELLGLYSCALAHNPEADDLWQRPFHDADHRWIVYDVSPGLGDPGIMGMGSSWSSAVVDALETLGHWDDHDLAKYPGENLTVDDREKLVGLRLQLKTRLHALDLQLGHYDGVVEDQKAQIIPLDRDVEKIS